MENELLTIQQIGELTGLSVHALRYYEKVGLLNPIARASNGHRRYSADNLAWVRFITRLRSTGMPIRHILRYAELLRQGEGTIPERIALLEEHRRAVEDHIAELQHHLNAITEKINNYSRLQPALQALTRSALVNADSPSEKEKAR